MSENDEYTVSYNLDSDNYSEDSIFGSHRLAFKSQQAHTSQNQREKLKEFLGQVKLE